jgi:hypothetical protein
MRSMVCIGWDYEKILGGTGGVFSSHVRYVVGNGFKIRFWHDIWCGDQTLKEAFLDMFNSACVKDALVADHLELSNDSYRWNVRLIRTSHNWDVDVFASFFYLLYSLRLRCGVEDKLC